MASDGVVSKRRRRTHPLAERRGVGDRRESVMRRVAGSVRAKRDGRLEQLTSGPPAHGRTKGSTNISASARHRRRATAIAERLGRSVAQPPAPGSSVMPAFAHRERGLTAEPQERSVVAPMGLGTQRRER